MTEPATLSRQLMPVSNAVTYAASQLGGPEGRSRGAPLRSPRPHDPGATVLPDGSDLRRCASAASRGKVSRKMSRRHMIKDLESSASWPSGPGRASPASPGSKLAAPTRPCRCWNGLPRHSA